MRQSRIDISKCSSNTACCRAERRGGLSAVARRTCAAVLAVFTLLPDTRAKENA
jgi:hypothetical protein